MKLSRLFYLILLLLTCISAVTWAQTGTISGKVTDEDGEPIAGAAVAVQGTNFTATANAAGEYTINDVPDGSYTIEATSYSYRPQTATVKVTSGQTATQDFALTIDLLALEEIVVTGTGTPERKIESSTSISTLTIEEINESAPRSTTEYLRRIPGFTRVESSGGEVNQNISVRGLLGVETVNLQEDGMPVYPTMHIFFMNADNLIRADENIEEVEVLRGGVSPIFGSSASAAIVNFINKTGGTELRGVTKGTIGSDGLARFDFNANGPLSNDWRFNFGGFYRYDRGVRDPGFPGVKGGQIKGSVTRLLTNGFFTLSGKYIDDSNQFILPLPFRNPADPEHVQGFSDTGAFTTPEAVNAEIPLPEGNGDLTFPLDDGIRAKAGWVTGHFNFVFGDDWEIQNVARMMSVDLQWNALTPGGLVTGAEFAQNTLNSLIADGTVPAGSTAQLLFTNHRDVVTGLKLPFDTANGLVSPGGLFHVLKPLSDFSNLLTVKKPFGNHKLSFGTYFAYYTQGNVWNIAGILNDVRDNPRLLDLVITQPDGTTLDVTKNGFRTFLDTYVNGDGNNTLIALFGDDQIEINDRLRVDLGLRYEHQDYFQVVEGRETLDLDGDPRTRFDREQWGTGTFQSFDFGIDDFAFSAGANYQLSPNRLAIYGSATRGFWMPALDEFLFETRQEVVELFEPRHTHMVEGGVKYASPTWAFTGTVYYGKLYNVISRGIEIDPITKAFVFITRESPDTSGYGFEFEASVRPNARLLFSGSTTIIDVEAPAGAQAQTRYEGLSPAVGNLEATFFLTSQASILVDWHHVGTRYSDPLRNIKLDNYNYVNLGATYKFPEQGVTLTGRVLNLNESKGFEEGDPRVDPTRGAAAEFFTARPLLPRRVTLELRYDWR